MNVFVTVYINKVYTMYIVQQLNHVSTFKGLEDWTLS